MVKYLVLLSVILISCVTKNSLNKKKRISEVEITHDEKSSLVQYLQLHDTSSADVENILKMIQKSKDYQKTGLHLAENEAPSQSTDQGKYDVLVCAKAQAGFLVTGGGAYCHSTKNKKTKYVSIVGVGVPSGAVIGAFWIFYTDYNTSQLYGGIKLGITFFVGLEGFAGYNSNYGSALGVGANVGVIGEGNITMLGIHPKKPTEKSE